MILGDHHVHTSHSKCVRDTYDLATIASAHQRLGFPYACVTDHVHQDGEGGYLGSQLAMRDTLRTSNPFRVFVGFELSILDFNGRVACPGSDFCPDGPLLFADHWIPGTSITMDDLPGSSAILKTMHANEPRKLESLYQDVATMYLKTMERNRSLAVLAHPFDTFLRAANFDGRLLDVFEQVCEGCQHHEVAIEVNEKALERYQDTYKNVTPIHEDCLHAKEFYDTMLHVANEYDVLFSAGSDAHAVKDIGQLDRVRLCLESLGIQENRMLVLPR